MIFALSNADASLAKELKIECTYESEENRKKAIKLRAHLTHFRDILVDILMQQDRMSTNPN